MTTPTQDSFSWKSEVFRFFLVEGSLLGGLYAPALLNNQLIRLLPFPGWALFLFTIFCIGSRRRWLRAHRPQSAPRPYRFSLQEWMVGFTGVALMLGLYSVD